MSVVNSLRDIWIKGNLEPKEASEKYRASMAGQCLLKNIAYKEGKDLEPYTNENLIIGNGIHSSVQQAIEAELGEKVQIEKEVVWKKYQVTGHIDIIYSDKDLTEVIDLKTISSYGYKKRFGLKKNKEQNPLGNYEMQISVYAKALEEEGYKNIHTYLFFIRKDDGKIKIQEVNWMSVPVEEYYETLIGYEKEKDDIIPGITPGVPQRGWECRYCFNQECELWHKR